MILNPYELGSLIDRIKYDHDFTVTVQEVEGLLDTISSKDNRIAQLESVLVQAKGALIYYSDCRHWGTTGFTYVANSEQAKQAIERIG
jgi:hypothetical protein